MYDIRRKPRALCLWCAATVASATCAAAPLNFERVTFTVALRPPHTPPREVSTPSPHKSNSAPAICTSPHLFGHHDLGEQVVSEPDAHAILDSAVGHGITTDFAEMYRCLPALKTFGATETILPVYLVPARSPCCYQGRPAARHGIRNGSTDQPAVTSSRLVKTASRSAPKM
jgi:hypothetical protein